MNSRFFRHVAGLVTTQKNVYFETIAAILLVMHSASNAQAQDLLINEVDVDQTGTDSAEFVELYDGGVGETSLDGFILVLFNGSVNTSYRTIDLSGFSTDATGFFVVGNPGVPNVAIEIEPGGSGAFQNGEDAIALYMASADEFPNGTPPTSNNLVDALVYGTNDDEAFELLDILTPGFEQVNDNNTESMARVPDGGTARDTSTYINQAPTPGLRNQADANLNLGISIDPGAFSESSEEPVTVTITRTGSTDSEATISLESSDPSEAIVPETATFATGESMITVPVTPVDDLWADGTQTVTISVREQNNTLTPADAVIDVEDDGDTNSIVVNEVYPAVDSFTGDANRDGTIDTGFDEFVELVNPTDAPVDLSGFVLRDAVVARHIFPDETIIDPGCAIVVFGGGDVAEGLLEDFGNALVQKANGANEFGLSLNNNGDVVSIRNLDDLEIAGASWGQVSFSDGSLTRSPDITGDFDSHAAVGFDMFGPGYDIDGDPLCETGLTLSLEATVTQFGEDAGAGVSTLTITRSGPTDQALVVILENGDPSEVSVPAEATIPAGSNSTTVMIDAVNDEADDGQQTVTISASAPGFVLTSIELRVSDDGDEPVAVVINEFDADQDGTDTMEFIELFDGGIGNLPLDGLIVVLYNGNGDVSYDTIDLSGQSTDANGFFVLGSADVPNVNLVVPGFQLQNGADGIAVYRDSAEFFPNNTFPTDDNLLDAVVYGTNDDDATGLLDALTPDAVQLNEGGSNNADALARVPNGGAPFAINSYVAQAPTPGASNGEGGGDAGFALWASAFPGVTDPNGNNDSDPLGNTLEYALDLDPTVNDLGALPFPALNQDGVLEFSITKGTIAGADPNLTYIVEASTDLTNWSTDSTTEITNDASTLTVTYTGDSPEAYLRLRVILTE